MKKISRGTRWSALISVIALLQVVFFVFGPSRIGSFIYKLAVGSLYVLDSKAMPTLQASRDGWPFPTLFGGIVYLAVSSLLAFFVAQMFVALLRRFGRRPNQSPDPTR
jgi:hypothetical protein